MSMSSRLDPSFSIAIIGASIAGLALAIGLRKQNAACKYTIYEAAPQFDAVGSGIGMGPNALRAMELMDAGFAELYGRIKVGNACGDRRHEQFEILSAAQGFGALDGWRGGSVSHRDFERSSGHRQALLEVMSALVPDGTVQFDRRVMGVEYVEGQTRVCLAFSGGEACVMVDTVVGCDGIKGVTRRVVLEMEYPEEIVAKYCRTYVYRNIVPMQEAKRILGSYADNAKWFMGEGRGGVMYAISKGEEVNVVVFIQDERPWVGEQAAMQVSREDMLSEFNGFDKRLLGLAQNLSDGPYSTILIPQRFTAAMSSSSGIQPTLPVPARRPGAGLGLEDALVMSRLLGVVKKPEQLEGAFEVYNSIRQPRAQAVVQGSQEALLAYFLVHAEFGHDIQNLTDYANTRLSLIWFHDLEGDVKTAGQRFRELTEAAQPDNREQ
ncbi:mannitol 1-phosphate dehydrogenase [Histoplasma capsulatum H143]|uniref:Mannitol 1-phosphate dehydrogenase n=1 Tax=Ajellomyces capsulatus (strain H143) TaxID=544712 RepID=C6HPK4_AJECH|nr:mannitol 1-phosphate dehydrogenase [Histoplasma capsulatum H143]